MNSSAFEFPWLAIGIGALLPPAGYLCSRIFRGCFGRLALWSLTFGFIAACAGVLLLAARYRWDGACVQTLALLVGWALGMKILYSLPRLYWEARARFLRKNKP